MRNVWLYNTVSEDADPGNIHCSGTIWNLTVETGRFLPGAGKMQDRMEAVGDLERKKSEFRYNPRHDRTCLFIDSFSCGQFLSVMNSFM